MKKQLLIALSILSMSALSNASSTLNRNVNNMNLNDADQAVFKTNFGFKTLMPSTESGLGTLAGASAASFINNYVYLGGAAFGGGFVGRVGGFGYAGALAGVEKQLNANWIFNSNLLLGAGGGKAAVEDKKGGFVFEPQASVNYLLSKGARVSFSTGYLAFPGISSISGFTAMVGLELKRFSLSMAD